MDRLEQTPPKSKAATDDVYSQTSNEQRMRASMEDTMNEENIQKMLMEMNEAIL